MCLQPHRPHPPPSAAPLFSAPVPVSLLLPRSPPHAPARRSEDARTGKAGGGPGAGRGEPRARGAVTEGTPGRSRAAPGGGVVGRTPGAPGGRTEAEERQRPGLGATLPEAGASARQQSGPRPGRAGGARGAAGRGTRRERRRGAARGEGSWERGDPRRGTEPAPERSASGSAANELRLRGPDGGGRRRSSGPWGIGPGVGVSAQRAPGRTGGRAGLRCCSFKGLTPRSGLPKGRGSVAVRCGERAATALPSGAAPACPGL